MRRLICVIALLLAAQHAEAADLPRYAPPEHWVVAASVPAIPQTTSSAGLYRLLQDEQLNFTQTEVDDYWESVNRIQTAQGLDAEGTITLSWDPAIETLIIHKLHILRGDSVIDVLGKDTDGTGTQGLGQSFTILRRENDLEGAMLDGVLTAVIQPAGLQIGDRIDIAYTRIRSDPVLHGLNEQSASFADAEPVDQLRLRARWPTAMPVRFLASSAFPGMRTQHDGGMETLIWAQDHAPALLQPDQAPSRFTLERTVAFSQFAGWNDVARLFAPVYQRAATLRAGSKLLAEIARIKASSTDKGTQAVAALALVQDRVHYVFLGMNDGGLVPAAADLTWQRRFGDCKGKTVLLLALLNGLGIEAAPVLVNTQTGDGLPGRLPMAGLFNHVLVRAVIAGVPYWLDGTRTGDGVLANIAVPTFHWGLKLTPDTTALMPIMPTPLAEPNETTVLRIDARGGMDAPAPFHGEVVFRGDYGVRLHQEFEDATPEEVERKQRKSWSDWYDFVDAKQVSARFDASRNEEHLVMDGLAHMRWVAHRYEADDAVLGYNAHFDRPPGPARDAAFSVDFPAFRTDQETILLPEQGFGYAVDGVDQDRVLAGKHYFRHASIDGDVFTLRTEIRSLAPEFSAAEAPADQLALRDMAHGTIYLRAFAEDAAAARLDAAKAAIDAADALHNRGDYDAAIAGYTSIIAANPGQAFLYANRGNSYLSKNDLARAKQDFDRAVKLDPTNPTAARGRGSMLVYSGQYKAAIAQLTLSLQREPHNAFALGKRALAYLGLGDSEDARSDITAALAAAPDDARFHMLRAFLLAANQTGQAITELDRAIALDPTLTGAVAERGLIYAELGNRAEAERDLTAAAAREPHNPTVATGRGVLALQAGDAAGALAFFAVARGSGDTDLALLFAQASAYLLAHDNPHALQVANQAIGASPGMDRLYLLRARIYLAMHDVAHARNQAQLVTAANPGRAEAWLTAGKINLAVQDESGCASAMTRAIALQPSVEAYLLRARHRPAADQAGRKADLVAALRLDPHSPIARSMQLDLQITDGDYAGLLTSVQAMIADHGPVVGLLGYRGFAYAKTGQSALAAKDFAAAEAKATSAVDLNEACWFQAIAGVALLAALKDCDAAVAKAPQNAALLDSRGFVLLRLQRYDEAILAYDRALKFAPGLADSLYGRGIAQQRAGKTVAAKADMSAALLADGLVAINFGRYGVGS